MARASPPPGLTPDPSGYLHLSPQLTEQLFSTAPLDQHYEIEDEPFARGKKAVVRRCRERTSGRRLAAKYLRRRSQGPGAEVLHEVAVLHACRRSPHVVQLHAVHQTPSDTVLLLELGQGGELQTVLDKDEVPREAEVVRVMSQVLQALVHLHSINIVHLDLKPQNIVLTGEFPNCDVKLCDFGISRYLCKGSDVREILGTPDYVAPEVLNYEPISLATDMWSAGVLMYVLLSGCSPFGGETKQETFCNISQCRLDFPDDLFETVSPEAKDLMTNLIKLKPCERLSAAECLAHPWFTKEHSQQARPAIPTVVVPEFKSSSEESTETLVDLSQQEVRQVEPITAPTKEKPTDRRKNRLSEKFDKLVKSITDREEERLKYTRESFRSMTRASGMQTMPITGFLKFRDQSLHTFKRVYIVDSPPMSLSTVSVSSNSSGFASADSSDSNSDSVSEMSLDSSSDRSSIVSLDESEYGFKLQRHSSCHDVWAATERSYRECRGSVAKAISRLQPRPIPLPKTPAKPGLELMKERKGNQVIIREIKTVTGSRFVRTSELKCESVQSRIRKFDPHKLDISRNNPHEIF